MSFETDEQITPALHPGDRLGYFDVQSPLAAGGLSLVWKGHDSLLNREVAIKQIANAAQADEAMRARFRQESELAKKASEAHKNLTQVIDRIEDERGLFIVMEYVDGSSLDRVLAKLDGPMDPKQALGILHQTAIALRAIHEAGIVHRDLKPGNILLPRDGGVKLCDFGQASLVGEQDMLALGTARYMAPELFTEQDVDARCDLYSLGMIAYEMLLGRPAFEQQFKTVLRDQRNQALRWMKWHTNPRLIAQPVAKLDPELPEELSGVVERLMDKNPAQRIGDAGQLLDVLKRHFSAAGRAAAAQEKAAEAAAQAQLAPPAEPTAPLPTRSKKNVVLAAVLGLLILATGGLLAYKEYADAQTARAERNQALGVIKAAIEQYGDGQFAEARTGFDKVFKDPKWKADLQIRTICGSYGFMCKAMLERDRADAAMDELNYGEALAAYDEANQSAERADDYASKGVGEKHVFDRDKIGGFRKSVRDARAFADICAKIDASIVAEDLDTARAQIIQVYDHSAIRRLSDGEKQILERFSGRIERLVWTKQLQALLDEADELAQDGKLNDAIDKLESARKDGNDSQLINDKIKAYERELRYNRALSTAKYAAERGDLAKAIVNYETANDIHPSNEIEDKLLVLRSRKAYEDGQDLEDKRDFVGAEEQYNLALSYDNTNERAKQALAQLGKASSKSKNLQMAERAFADRKYAEAVNLYRRALDIETDPDTQERLNVALTRMHTQKAQEAYDRWDLKAARQEIDEALQHDPADIRADRLKADILVAINYQALVDAGDAFYRQGRFADASMKYHEAREAAKGSDIDTKDVNRKFQDSKYEDWMAKARAAVEARQWNVAAGYVSAALNIRETAEAFRLKDTIDKARNELGS